MISSRYLPGYLFVLLAAALLAMTLFWQVPMMLWDHLNLVPMLAAWQHGELAQSAFFRFDGGHLHTAAYAILLVAARLTHGHPWLDDVLGWALLVSSAALVMVFVRDSFRGDPQRTSGLVLMVVFLALYPGHLANLQWGWQVAVFLCLFGVTLAIHALTRPRLSWLHNGVAMAGAVLACFSFATAIAIFPIALVLLVLRSDASYRRRWLMAVPWVAACAALGGVYLRFASPGMARDVPTELHYLLNFLGAGISRFATDAAAWLAVAGILLAGLVAWRDHGERDALPWIGLVLFGLLAGVVVALGRATGLGADQAFASRYVSFSSFFWLGTFALLGRAYIASPSRRQLAVLAVISVFAVGNALQLMHRASQVGARTHAIADAIRGTWPEVSRPILDEIYFDKAQVAHRRLQRLHEWGYAPFSRADAHTAGAVR